MCLLADPYWDSQPGNSIPGNSPNRLALVVQKIVGFVISTIAIAQGAPFC
jgi:hypothetical protein